MSKKFGFGIVGCGVISKWHSDSIKEIEGAELIGVYDKFKEGAERFASENGCTFFETFEDMLASEDIDAICICTPSGTHAPLAIQAANSGKNIIVEKPVAITEEQIAQLVEAVEKNGVKLAVVSQLRFNDAVKKAKKAITEGRLGKILLGDVYMKYYRSSEYYSSSAWRGTWAMDGGGALMNQGIHGIDILQYLAGPVKSVSAICKTLDRDIEVEDAANIIVEYEHGGIGVIQGTTCTTPGYPRRLEITGTKGTIVIEEDTIIKWDIEGEEGEITAEKTDVASFKDPSAFNNENHKRQIEDLINAVKEDRPPLVDLYEGKRPVEIILAAYESSKRGTKIEL